MKTIWKEPEWVYDSLQHYQSVSHLNHFTPTTRHDSLHSNWWWHVVATAVRGEMSMYILNRSQVVCDTQKTTLMSPRGKQDIIKSAVPIEASGGKRVVIMVNNDLVRRHLLQENKTFSEHWANVQCCAGHTDVDPMSFRCWASVCCC